MTGPDESPPGRLRMQAALRLLQGKDPDVVAQESGFSLAELSRALDEEVRKIPALKDKVKFKVAIVEGQEVSFAEALTMPTRAELLGQIVTMIMSPASGLVSQIMAPASQIAGAVASIAEKKEEAPAQPAA